MTVHGIITYYLYEQSFHGSIHFNLLYCNSRSQEILKMEKSHAECLHASIEQADKDFPESIALSADNGSSSPSTLEVPCPIEIAGSRSEINADPLDECSNEACRPAKGREEDNLRYSC